LETLVVVNAVKHFKLFTRWKVCYIHWL